MLIKATREYTKIMKGTTDTSLLAMRQIEGQADILQRFMDAFSDRISRQEYNSQFETSAVAMAEQILKGKVTHQDVMSGLYTAIESNPKLYSQVCSLLQQMVGSKYTWFLVGEQVIEQGLSYLGVPGATTTDTFKELFGVLFFAHHPEATLAWMQTLDKLKYSDDGPWYRRLYVNCPVVVSVYDSSDKLLVQIKDDETTHYNGSLLSAYIDGAGQKIVALPADGDYRIEVEATDDGTVSYSIAECSMATGEISRMVNYYDIPVKKGEKLIGQMPAEATESTEPTNYQLTRATGSKQEALTAAEDQSGDQVVRHTVTCQAEEGGTVYGGGTFVHGEYAKLTAEEAEGWKFAGWYQGESLMSSESEYRFRVGTDATFTAKFVKTPNDGGSGGGGYTYYTIKATAGVNGSISPSGNVSVREGWDQTFTITPDKGCAVARVLIDDKNVGAVKSYTFEDVKKNHTIEVVFMKAGGDPQTGVFVDVPEDSYYEDAVIWAVGKGITTGTDATHFTPNGSCTRAQAVTFLWRAAGSPAAKSAAMPFADVKVGSYYTDAVLWAVENGITEGTSATEFSPDAACTRGQIVTLLWRAEKGAAAGAVEHSFADVGPDAYYYDAVLWAVGEGVTNGTTQATFSPDAVCTRAQIVTFIYRALAE